jgi:Caspase domain
VASPFLSEEESKESKAHALLIGIDCYLPNRLPSGGNYPSLGGCVSDINRIEDFLIKELALPSVNISKLTSTISDDTGRPKEAKNEWPTYKNIVLGFKQIMERAQQGDQILVYYSGHGGRAKTAYPMLKGKEGIDEALVPIDIGNSEARYLRDLELAHLLNEMAKKEILVTIVLDSCHSGGATRGITSAAVRGISTIDETNRPTDSMVATEDQLIRTWSELYGTRSMSTRNVELGSGWLPESKQIILLAACRANEFAIEDNFDGIRSGVLTYYLLESFRTQKILGLSYKKLHNIILAKIHARYPSQTPILEGDTSRAIFGIRELSHGAAVNVTQVDNQNNEMRLNTGNSQGIGEGSTFAIYPIGTNNFDEVHKRLAIAEVTKSKSTESWAKVIERFGQATIDVGAQAVLLNFGRMDLVKKVGIPKVDRTGLQFSTDQIRALEGIRDKILKMDKGFVRLAEEDEAPDYQISLNLKNEYEIWDSAGRNIPNLNPPLKISGTDASELLLQRLVHLARYSNIQRIDNDDQNSALKNILDVNLFQYREDHQLKDDSSLRPVTSKGNVNLITIGEKMILRIRNRSSNVLNVTALDLQPDWGISQIVPDDDFSDFETLEPNTFKDISLEASLPAGYKEGKDMIKIFATVEPTSFLWLKLPSLDQVSLARSFATRQPRGGNALETLMMALTDESQVTMKTRNLNKYKSANSDWAVTQLEIHVMQ